MNEWIKIGQVDVDSGLLMVGDPCYFEDGYDWGEFCESLGDEYPTIKNLVMAGLAPRVEGWFFLAAMGMGPMMFSLK